MKYSKRREYRIASVVLLATTILLPTLLSSVLKWQWLALAAGFPFYCALVFITYTRFRNASISILCLVPMIFIFHFGPKWDIGSVTLYPTGLISFLPIVIGWIARDDYTDYGDTDYGDIA